MKVWIFQANPKRYDIRRALSDENLQTEKHWLVKQYTDKIRKGDVCLIWMCGKPDERGIYAVGRITTNPAYILDTEEESKYWMSDNERGKKSMRVKFVYTRKLLNNPILIGEIKNHAELRNLLIIRQPQCSNSPVEENEWKAIENLIKDR